MKQRFLAILLGVALSFSVYAALETGDFLDDLVITNPTGADDYATADDHLRLIKKVIKASFPNIDAAVTASVAELNLIDGVTSTTAELNLVDGITAIQEANATLDELAALAKTDSNFIVGNGSAWVAETGATARTSLGVGTGDSPQFTAVNVGAATDTTVTRVSAGLIAVEGNTVLTAATGQPLDTELTEIAALANTNNNFIVGTGAVWALETPANVRTSLGLVIGTNVQAQDTELDEIAALANTDGNFIVGTGTVWAAESGVTAQASLGVQLKVKTADEVVTTSITLQDDDHLVGFVLVTDKRYAIEALLQVADSASGEFDYAWIFTNAAQSGKSSHHTIDESSTDKGNTPISTRDQVAITTGTHMVKVEGLFHANASTGGTFKLQWCQGTSSGTTTVFEGSWVRVTQLTF